MFIGDSKVEVGPMSMGTWAMGGGQQWGENDDSQHADHRYRKTSAGL